MDELSNRVDSPRDGPASRAPFAANHHRNDRRSGANNRDPQCEFWIGLADGSGIAVTGVAACR